MSKADLIRGEVYNVECYRHFTDMCDWNACDCWYFPDEGLTTWFFDDGSDLTIHNGVIQ